MQGKMEEKRKLNIKVTYEHELLNPFYAANDLEIAALTRSKAGSL